MYYPYLLSLSHGDSETEEWSDTAALDFHMLAFSHRFKLLTVRLGCTIVILWNRITVDVLQQVEMHYIL